MASKRQGGKVHIAKFIAVRKLSVGGRKLKSLGWKESTVSDRKVINVHDLPSLSLLSLFFHIHFGLLNIIQQKSAFNEQ